MEVDQGEGEANVQTTTHSTMPGTDEVYSSSELKSRKELDRWKQKFKDVRSPLTPLFAA